MIAKALSVRWEDDCTRYIVLGHVGPDEFFAAISGAERDECSLPYFGERADLDDVKLEHAWLRHVPMRDSVDWSTGKWRYVNVLRRASGPGPGAFSTTIWLYEGVDFDTPQDRADWREARAGGYA